MSRPINRLIVHCSYTPPSMDIGAAEIDVWHKQRNPPFRMIGYHYVIRRNGQREKGRNEAVAWAHTLGQNFDSLGVCLVGGMAEGDKRAECNFTAAQFLALEQLIRELHSRYPNIKVSGHNDWDPHRACPTFNARAFAEWL
jgi:N-acetylmuramoyl-L-alanine amidase